MLDKLRLAKEELREERKGEEFLFPMSFPSAAYDLATGEPHANYRNAVQTVTDILRDAGYPLSVGLL